MINNDRGDRLNVIAAAIGAACIFGLPAIAGYLSERDERIAVEERIAQIERAAEVSCPAKPDHRLVSTINASADGELARWCGYFRTTIESVRIEWELAR